MTDQSDDSDRSDRPVGIDQPRADDGLDSAEAFALLGDATRLEIVSALHDHAVDSPIRFSDLYDRVDVRDSAQFNYHLKQLRPHFVAKTEEGYELTSAGRRLARAVTAGTYTESPTLDPFEIGGDCYACGESALWASYEDERLDIECRACGELVLGVRVPPTLVRGRDPEEVVEAFDNWARLQAEQAQRGVCPDCGGPVESAVSEEFSDVIVHEAVPVFDCEVCGRTTMLSFGGIASRHPEVEAFHRERGESLDDRPYWEVPQHVAGDHIRVLSRDPWRVRVSFFAGGDACHATIDADLEVVETEVVPGDG